MSIQSRIRDLLGKSPSFIVEPVAEPPGQYSDDVVVEALQRALARKNKEINFGKRHVEDCRSAVAELETSITKAIADIAVDEEDVAKIEAALLKLDQGNPA